MTLTFAKTAEPQRESMDAVSFSGEPSRRLALANHVPQICDSCGAYVERTIALRFLKKAEGTATTNPAETREWIAKAVLILNECGESHRGKEGAASPERGRLAPWQISRTIHFIDSNLATKITIRQLAGIAHLSSSYFCQAFRCTLDESPFSYIRRRRIARAQELMLTTDDSLSEIALECGFADQAHLTNIFRGVVGISPGHWRRQRKSPDPL